MIEQIFSLQLVLSELITHQDINRGIQDFLNRTKMICISLLEEIKNYDSSLVYNLFETWAKSMSAFMIKTKEPEN